MTGSCVNLVYPCYYFTRTAEVRVGCIPTYADAHMNAWPSVYLVGIFIIMLRLFMCHAIRRRPLYTPPPTLAVGDMEAHQRPSQVLSYPSSCRPARQPKAQFCRC